MIEHGFVSFVASDAHNEYRPCVLLKAKKIIAEEFEESIVIQLTKINPEKILSNEMIYSSYLSKIKKTKRSFWDKIKSK